jgi:hypothetical protein
MGRFARAPGSRLDTGMARRFLTILTGRNLSKIQQRREHVPSTIKRKDDRGL